MEAGQLPRLQAGCPLSVSQAGAGTAGRLQQHRQRVCLAQRGESCRLLPQQQTVIPGGLELKVT